MHEDWVLAKISISFLPKDKKATIFPVEKLDSKFCSAVWKWKWTMQYGASEIISYC